MSKVQQQQNDLQSGLARKSLGFGLVSLVGLAGVSYVAIQFAIQRQGGLALSTMIIGMLTGLPAIITGFRAQKLARENPQRPGKPKLAVAGISLGFATSALALVLIVMALNANKAVQRDLASENCRANLMALGRALQVYAIDHRTYPADLLQLQGLLRRPEKLWCQGDTNHSGRTNWAMVTLDNVTYELLQPRGTETDNQTRAVLRCPIHHTEWWGNATVHRSHSNRVETLPQ